MTRGMTREEAINILNRDDDSMRKGYFCINDFKAIEVLKSQEPILDKIRAEIMDWQTDIHDNEYDAETHDFVFERIYEIIDECKAESEE